MSLCFTLARNRRRITQIEFNWNGFCDGGRSEAHTEVGRGGLPRVARNGRFRLSSTNFSFGGRFTTRRRARGTLEMKTSGPFGDCESGPVRWNARRG